MILAGINESVSQNQKVGAGGTAAIGCYADSRVFMVTGKSVPFADIAPLEKRTPNVKVRGSPLLGCPSRLTGWAS